ncbi:hypothetical protein GCM10020000_84800 [Streptomyces olivoverticillatus]
MGPMTHTHGPLRRCLSALAALAAAAGTLLAPAPASAASRTAAGCDQQCRIDEAWQQQRTNALPRAGFYDVPAPLPPGPARHPHPRRPRRRLHPGHGHARGAHPLPLAHLPGP